MRLSVVHSHPMSDRKSSSITRGDLLSATEVAEEFAGSGISAVALRRWAREGQIPAVRFPSGRVRFRREDIEALLTPKVMSPDEASNAVGHHPVMAGQEALTW